MKLTDTPKSPDASEEAVREHFMVKARRELLQERRRIGEKYGLTLLEVAQLDLEHLNVVNAFLLRDERAQSASPAPGASGGAPR